MLGSVLKRFHTGDGVLLSTQDITLHMIAITLELSPDRLVHLLQIVVLTIGLGSPLLKVSYHALQVLHTVVAGLHVVIS